MRSLICGLPVVIDDQFREALSSLSEPFLQVLRTHVIAETLRISKEENGSRMVCQSRNKHVDHVVVVFS